MSEFCGSFYCILNTIPANVLNELSDWFLTGWNGPCKHWCHFSTGGVGKRSRCLAEFTGSICNSALRPTTWGKQAVQRETVCCGKERKQIKYKLLSSCLIPKSKFKSSTACGAGPDTFHQHARKQIGWYDYGRFFRWDTSVLQSQRSIRAFKSRIQTA